MTWTTIKKADGTEVIVSNILKDAGGGTHVVSNDVLDIAAGVHTIFSVTVDTSALYTLNFELFDNRVFVL